MSFTVKRADGSTCTYDLTTTEVRDQLASFAIRGNRMTADERRVYDDLRQIQDEQRARLIAAANNAHALEGPEQVEERARAAAASEAAGSAGPRGTRGGRSRPASPAARSVDLARGIVAELHGRNLLDSVPAEVVERMLTKPEHEAAETAQWVRATGEPDYLAAFAKHLADPLNGHLDWTPAEAEAWRMTRAYSNALGTTTGAPMLPLVLDPAIMLTNDGSLGGIRSVARQVQIAGKSWNGVTSAGATAEWKAEHAEAADGTPSVDGKEVPVHMLDVDALVSYELAADALDFATELARVLADAATVKVDAALATGSGDGQPTGVITAVSAAGHLVGTSGAFGAANVVALQNALPARFQPGAAFVAPLPVINTIGSFETSNGALRFPDVENGRLLRRPLVEDSNVAADLTTTGSKPLIYGSWWNYLVVARVGSTIEVLPGYGENGRPTAQRHFFMTMRLGADTTVPGAFRVLNKS